MRDAGHAKALTESPLPLNKISYILETIVSLTSYRWVFKPLVYSTKIGGHIHRYCGCAPCTDQMYLNCGWGLHLNLDLPRERKLFYYTLSIAEKCVLVDRMGDSGMYHYQLLIAYHLGYADADVCVYRFRVSVVLAW